MLWHSRARMTVALSPFAFALIGFTIISTSFLSGMFGMAGGMILVGVLLAYFDVATGMVVFSVIQMVANGWRAVIWSRFVIWRIFFVYVVGAVISFAIMRYVAIVPSKAAVYLGLGLMPFLIELLPVQARPNIEWRGVPFLTGVLTTVIQLLTGVGGLFLDIFFQKSMLDRKTTIATKAVTQTFSHIIRALYFGSFVGITDVVPVWTYLPAIALSLAGTSLAAQVLERMTDVGFRQWTRRVIFAVSAVYLARGVMLIFS
ncbi:MAG: TSUP family transporter [Alphaproteobacteria bacterium]|nr:TSUP family transporter [Alphaproteobacteria bacterium]